MVEGGPPKTVSWSVRSAPAIVVVHVEPWLSDNERYEPVVEGPRSALNTRPVRSSSQR